MRHDIWDRDFPVAAEPRDRPRDGRTVDAVAQTSKQGYVFLFDRVTGSRSSPIKYRKYPRSPVDGEIDRRHRNRCLPRRRPSRGRSLTEAMLTQADAEAHAAVLTDFQRMRSGGAFVPFSWALKP